MGFIDAEESVATAPWCSGQAFGTLDPATAVRICPGLCSMKAHARVELEFPEVHVAKAVAAAVAPDDETYVSTRRAGRTIRANADAAGVMSLLHTLEDYLACVSVAEKAARAALPPGRRPRHRA